MIGLAVWQNDVTLCVAQVPALKFSGHPRQNGNHPKIQRRHCNPETAKDNRWQPPSVTLCRVNLAAGCPEWIAPADFLSFPLLPDSVSTCGCLKPTQRFARPLVSNLARRSCSARWASGFKLHVISVKDFSKHTCRVWSVPCQARLHLRTPNRTAGVTRCVTSNA